MVRPHASAIASPVIKSKCLRRQRSTSRPVSRWRCSGFIGSAPFHVGERTRCQRGGIAPLWMRFPTGKKARCGRRAKTTHSNAMGLMKRRNDAIEAHCTPHRRSVSTCVTCQLAAVSSSTLTVRIRTRRLPRSHRVLFRFARSTAACLSRGSVC